MIWLLTRAMISSTTCPRASAGRHAKAVRIRQSFFIEFDGPPRFLGLRAKRWSGPDCRYFTPLQQRRKTLSILSLGPWQAAVIAGERIRRFAPGRVPFGRRTGWIHH